MRKGLPFRVVGTISILLLIPALTAAQSKPRARALGIPFDGNPGPLNAITDVKGVEVGHSTIIAGDGKLQVGVGPVRTGDRKSTRLNSSHSSISYAVFCLKKNT